jgi:hypothetical protein
VPLRESYFKNATARVEKLTGESVLAIGFCNRVGSMGAVIASAGQELATGGELGGFTAPRGSLVKDGKKVRLPLNFIVAVTPTSVHVYKHRMFWGRVKIKRELGSFDRGGLEVAVEDAKLTKRFALRSPSGGAAVAFEMTRSKFADGLAAALSA